MKSVREICRSEREGGRERGREGERRNRKRGKERETEPVRKKQRETGK